MSVKACRYWPDVAYPSGEPCRFAKIGLFAFLACVEGADWDAAFQGINGFYEVFPFQHGYFVKPGLFLFNPIRTPFFRRPSD